MSGIPTPTVDRNIHSILVVDDNPAMKYVLSRMLRAKGFKTVEAGSGAAAMELSEFVSAVVLDLNLPDVHGLEVCRLLRSRPATAMLPIVHVSALSKGEAVAQVAAGAGADTFLEAPVDPDLLASVVEALIAARTLEGHHTSRGAHSGSGSQSIIEKMQSARNPGD